MASLPKELKGKGAHMHITTPAGHAAGADAGSQARQEKEDLSMENGKHVTEGSFLKHPQLRDKTIHQKKLVNDMAYFLHHPQFPAHGPKMPPSKPREDKKSK